MYTRWSFRQVNSVCFLSHYEYFINLLCNWLQLFSLPLFSIIYYFRLLIDFYKLVCLLILVSMVWLSSHWLIRILNFESRISNLEAQMILLDIRSILSFMILHTNRRLSKIGTSPDLLNSKLTLQGRITYMYVHVPCNNNVYLVCKR
jgi:hypothetical protein